MDPRAFDWEKFPHQGGSGDPYVYEFDTGHFFKQRLVAKLYKAGRLEIQGHLYNDPSGAAFLRGWGIDFKNANETAGIEFRTPSGVRIRKGTLWQAARCLLFDHNHKIATYPTWNHIVTYYGPQAYPAGGESFAVRIPNPNMSRPLKIKVQPMLNLALSYAAVYEGPFARYVDVGGYLLDVYRDARLPDIDPKNESSLLLRLAEAQRNQSLGEKISEVTDSELTVPYLRWTEVA